MHSFQWHIGDYLAATSHLSKLEDLAYRRLLEIYYLNEKPIETDPVSAARRIRFSGDDEVAAVASVLLEFFVEHDDGWHQKRVLAEIERYRERAASARNNGKKGGRPKSKASGLSHRNRMGTQSVSAQKPSSLDNLVTNNLVTNTPPTPLQGDDVPPEFSAWWSRYPNKGNKPAALRAWRKLKPANGTIVAIMAGLDAAIHSEQWQREGGQFIPLPASWLNGRRWEDRPATAGKPMFRDEELPL